MAFEIERGVGVLDTQSSEVGRFRGESLNWVVDRNLVQWVRIGFEG